MIRLLFPLLIAVAELGAGAVCAYKHDWRMSLVWTCYAVATFALAGK